VEQATCNLINAISASWPANYSDSVKRTAKCQNRKAWLTNLLNGKTGFMDTLLKMH